MKARISLTHREESHYDPKAIQRWKDAVLAIGFSLKQMPDTFYCNKTVETWKAIPEVIEREISSLQQLHALQRNTGYRWSLVLDFKNKDVLNIDLCNGWID